MIRKINKVLAGRTTRDGAGVKLQRIFGYSEIPMFDPFLMLDAFGSDKKEDYIRGFPWHPHRGIETITYMLEGSAEHGDSLGNSGIISSGDVQWMTAGSGIIHQEMPKGDENERMFGFQLWANLPASHKMMKPRYQDVKSSAIPVIDDGKGTIIKVICGKVKGVSGPVTDIITDPEYIDVSLKSDILFEHEIRRGHTAFAFVYAGSARFYGHSEEIGAGSAVLFDDGEEVEIRSLSNGANFILVSGEPIREPIAWGGPIVMNTQEELQLAFEEYDNGTFIKQ